MRSDAHRRGAGARDKSSRFAKRVPVHRSSDCPVATTGRATVPILISVIVGTALAIMPARVEMYDTTLKQAVLCLGAAALLWSPDPWWRTATGLGRTEIGRAFYWALLLCAVSLVISSSFSSDPWLAFGGNVWRRLGASTQAIVFMIAGLIAACAFRQRSAAKAVMLGMEFAGAVAGIYAIVQYSGHDPLIPISFYTSGTPPAVRPPATLTQATLFATFLLPAILIAAGFRLRETRSSWKRAHEAILAASVAALLLSGTRSALLGLAVAGCLLLYFERNRIANRRVLRAAGFAVLVFAAAAIIFMAMPASKAVRARFRQWTADPAGGPRLLVWRDSLRLFSQHPILGVGPELFEQEFRKSESLELARAFPDHYHESPHNFFLEIANAQGSIGLLSWAALLLLAVYSGVINCRSKDSDAATLLAALIGMIISLQFCPLTMTNELYVVALAALLVALKAPHSSLGISEQLGGLRGVASGCAQAVGVTLLFVAFAYVAQASLYTLVENRALGEDFATAEQWYRLLRELPIAGPNLDLSRRIAVRARRLPSPLREEGFGNG